MLPWLPTGGRAHTAPMPSTSTGFEITLRDRTTELVAEADTYAHEKTMTTFYRTNNARRAIDCWSVPVASVRTDEILMIKAGANAAATGAADDTTATVHHLQTA